MDRLLLALVTSAATAVAWVAPSWPWVSGIAAALVGAVGLVTTAMANRRAAREEARAVRAERRAEEAEKREQEAHGWDRERREQEQAEARARNTVARWVEAKKAEHGTVPFSVDIETELGLARAARRMGFVDLTELDGGDEGVLDARAWVLV